MRATNVVTEERRVSESGSGQGSMYPLSGTFRHAPPHSGTEPRNRYNLFENLGATLAHLAYSKSIWLESGSNQLFFFAYLTVLWTFEIDIAREWEQSALFFCIPYSTLDTRNRYRSRVGAIAFPKRHTFVTFERLFSGCLGRYRRKFGRLSSGVVWGGFGVVWGDFGEALRRRWESLGRLWEAFSSSHLLFFPLYTQKCWE